MNSTRDIDHLIEMMAKLPGLGPRSARRAVLHLIRKRELKLTPLADLMQIVAATARECARCGNVGTTDICDICRDDRRANGMLCVVEDVADLVELRIPRLIDRLEPEGITEVILALNATVDGQTTAHYIADQIEHRVTLTSLAKGVPIGGELDYLDDGTITAALSARKVF